MNAQKNEAGAVTPTSHEIHNFGTRVAREFIANGTPVFVAPRPDSEGENRAISAAPRFMSLARRSLDAKPAPPEFEFPRGWQTLEPDPSALNGWKPDSAVCAVTGVQFDVIDVDPRNGGDVSLAALRDARVLPPIYGEVQTPSGGVHLYIARTGFRKGSPAAGIDLQAGDANGKGRGFVFIPHTMRASKVDGKQRLYKVTQPIDWEAMRHGANHPDAEIWLRFLHARLGANWIERQAAPVYTGGEHTEREKRYLATTLENICLGVQGTSAGSRNNTLNRAAYRVGQLVAGCGLDANEAYAALVRAGVATGLPEREAAFTVERSIQQGMAQPLAPGPFAENNEDDN